MIDLIKEHKELFKNQLLDYINELINTAQKNVHTTDVCDVNFYSGSLDALFDVKEYIKEM